VGDVVFDAGDGGGVGLAVNGGGPGDGGFGGSRFGQGDEARRRVESKPEEGESIRRSGLKRFVESRGGFVTEKSRSVPAFVFYEGLNLVQGRQDFIQRLRLNDLMRLGEIQPLIFFSEQEFLFLWFHCEHVAINCTPFVLACPRRKMMIRRWQSVYLHIHKLLRYARNERRLLLAANFLNE
jgi:hypothetical protein